MLFILNWFNLFNFFIEKWLSLIKGVVCFGGSGNEYVIFVVLIEGFLMLIKLIYVSGFSLCKRNFF